VHGSSLDPYAPRYAQRTRGMTASEIRALFSVAARPEVVSLAGGMPSLSVLPMDEIAALVADVVARRGQTALQYSSGQGNPQLREHITEIMALEGIQSSADDIVVTVGSQQALDLVCRIFLDPGDTVIVEGPSYVGALGVFAAAEANVVHVPLDGDGLIPGALQEAITRLQAEGRVAKLIYTVPNYHNPGGVTLAESRRDEILDIASRAGIFVLEDNPYGLLGFEEEAPPALRSRDRANVIYLGSFSKTFAPGLRVGWVLAPEPVCEKLVLATESQVLCPPTFSQEVVATYLSNQPWREQIKAFRVAYHVRRDAMLSALDQYMPPGCQWTRPTGGFYVWMTLPDGMNTKTMLPRAIHERVAYVPGVGFYANGDGQASMRLSYCFPEPDRIHEGVRRLGLVIEEELGLFNALRG
jgi:2-aminoadipate transaminase